MDEIEISAIPRITEKMSIMSMDKVQERRCKKEKDESLFQEHKESVKEIDDAINNDRCNHHFRINFVEKNWQRAQEVFGLMMRAHYRKNENDKFQPSKDELEFLKSMTKAFTLCANLHYRASLKEFYMILHPKHYNFPDENYLDRKDSIFHLHQDSVRKDMKEFDDLERRAKRLAESIASIASEEVHLAILDGHGRMLVCILKALDEKGILGRKNLFIDVYETSTIVYEYHKFVLPEIIKKINGSIIRGLNPAYEREITEGGFIYLNFCSIPTTAEVDWTAHFEEQHINNWVPACCKENVLKFIVKVTQPPFNNTVMISFVIKHMLKPNEYHHVFRETLGNYITGLGFLFLLRERYSFDAEIISIRPDNEIEWKDQERRIPTKLRSGKRGCPFVTLLVKPQENRYESLKKQLENWPIADLKESKLQIGSEIVVTSGKHRGLTAHIQKRTAAQVQVNGYRINITKVEKI